MNSIHRTNQKRKKQERMKVLNKKLDVKIKKLKDIITDGGLPPKMLNILVASDE